jgi:polysaccharide pyruvyl transferase WcaK-like protein
VIRDLPIDQDRPNLDPIKICLYTAVTEHDQYVRYASPWWQRGKSIARCTVDRVATRLSGRLFVNTYHYFVMTRRRDNSNRGDIGIRLAVRQRLTEAFAPRRVEFIEVAWGSLTDDIIVEIDRDCNLFIIAGGGYVFIAADGSAGDRLVDVPLLGKIRCPVIAYGIGLNRLMHEGVCDMHDLPTATKQKIKAVSEACRMVSVRDGDTQTLFRLCSDKPAALIGDPALFLGTRRGARCAIRSNPKPVIGLNLAAHGWRAVAVLKRVLPHFIALLRAVVRDYDPELVYFLHHDLERPVIALLKDRGFRFRLVDSDPESMIEQYTHVDFVICQMLHSCVFSANANTPFLNIAYDSKSLAFASLLGVPDSAVPYCEFEAAGLKKRFDDLYHRRGELSEIIERRKAKLDAETWKFMAELMSVVRVFETTGRIN